jgi:hypothetical protein
MVFDPYDTPPGLELSGYRLEKPLVADANAATTAPADNLLPVGTVLPSAWQAGASNRYDAGDNDRSRRRAYLFRAQRNPVTDQDQEFLDDARFEWTVNEGTGTNRQEYMGYNAALRRWDLLFGKGPVDAGVVGVGTAFLKPIPNEDLFGLPSYRQPVPYAVSIGSVSSLFGTQLTVVMVDTFGAPAAGTVECDRATGELNFSATELASSPNIPVYYQQQRFRPIDETQEALGEISNDPILALNPIPPTGSKPHIRIGFREVYLTPLEEPSEPLSAPPAGSVRWAADTGVLLFNTTDLATYTGESVYYDGVIMTDNVAPQLFPGGTMASPTPLVVRLDNTVFTFLDGGGTRRSFVTVEKKYESQTSSPGGPFLDEEVLDDPTNIPIGEIQYALDTGKVVVSSAAIQKYGGSTALSVIQPYFEFVHGGDHGWVLLLRPTPVNPERADTNPKDITIRTQLEGQVLANSLGLADRVLLSNLPIQGTLAVEVQQNSGSFLGELPSWDAVAPSYTGLVHVLDTEAKAIRFGDRKVLTGLSVLPDRIFTMPDQFLVPGSVELTLNAAPLVPGDDVLLDLTAGQITFIETFGLSRTTGFRGETAVADTFQDLSQDFVTAGVVSGDRLIVLSGPSSIQGSYEIVGVGATALTVDNTSERATPFTSIGDTGLVYEVHSAPEVLADNTFDPVTTQDPFVEVYRRPVSGPDELLEFGVDYSVAPELDTVVLSSEPLREGESLRIVFDQANDDGTDSGVQYDEIMGVRVIETIDPYSTTSHTFQFNTAGLTTIPDRGSALDVQGRPARANKFVTDFSLQTVTILEPTRSEFKQPNEQRLTAGPCRLTYYVEEAAGGESAFHVQNGPIYSPAYLIPDSSTDITVVGDQTATFLAGRIVRVGRELAEVSAATYDAGTNLTTVSFTGQLKAAQRNPDVWVTRYTPSFVSLSVSYVDAPVGSLLVRFVGDVTTQLQSGTIVRFGTQVHIVSEASFNGTHTETRLRTKTRETLTSGTHPADYSTRPVYEVGQQTFNTSLAPLLNPAQARDVSLFIRRPPDPGVELELGVDYTLAGSTLTLTAGLQSGEALDLEYTGLDPVSGTLDASYVRYIAPDDDNGLLRQRLVADMTLLTPDSWYCRVEPVAQFVAETVGDLGERAAALMPSSGPVVASSGPLANWEQGRQSLYYQRGKIVDEDFVGRRMIAYTDQLVRYLEGLLRWLIGLVPGNVDVDIPTAPTSRTDGPFRFFLQEADENQDGWVNPYDPFDASRYDAPIDPARLNDIDDVIKVDDSPFSFSGSGSPLTATSIGTYKAAWERHAYSRFDPLSRTGLTRTFLGAGSFGDPLAVFAAPEEKNGPLLLTYRSSTSAAMNPVPARFLHDYNLTFDDQLQEAPLVQARSVLFQVIAPDPVPGFNYVDVDLRAMGDVWAAALWEMVPSMFRPSITDFSATWASNCDVYRRGSAAPIYTNVAVSFVAVSTTLARVSTPTKLDLQIGDQFWISLSGTPPVDYPEGLSYSLDRSTHRLLSNQPYGGGPALPPSDGSGDTLEVEGTVKMVKVASEPLRIPALFGLPYNDSWDQVPPLLTPIPDPEPLLLQTELDAAIRVRDETARGFSGTDGTVSPAAFVAVTLDEADGENFLSSPAVELLDALRITDDPVYSNEGHYLVRGSVTPTAFVVFTLQWQDPAPTPFDAVIEQGTCTTLPGSVPPNQLEDLSANFVALFAGVPFPNPAITVTIAGEAGSPFGILSVVDATHIELDAPVTGVAGAAYQIDYASTASINAGLDVLTDLSAAPPDLSNVASLGELVVISGTSRNDGSYIPSSSTASSITLVPFQSPVVAQLTWYVKRGQAVHASTGTGEVTLGFTFRDRTTIVSGVLTGTTFAVTAGVQGDTQVGDVVIFGFVGPPRALIINIAWPNLTLDFSTAHPGDGPYTVEIYRNFELDLVGSTHPTRQAVAPGDVLILTTRTQIDFGRYIISAVAEEDLTVTRESDLASGFYSGGATGLDFRIDDCRRDELVLTDSLTGSWRQAIAAVTDTLDDTTDIPEVGFSYDNHLVNASGFLGSVVDMLSPLAVDAAASLTSIIDVLGTVDFTVAGVVEGDMLFVQPGDSDDINHGLYIIASVSGTSLTVNSAAGPDFYVNHVIAAKRPRFTSTPVAPVTVAVFRRSSFGSAFAALMAAQENLQGQKALQLLGDAGTWAQHQPATNIHYGDIPDSRIGDRIGPDTTTQYAATITDRLDRIRDSASSVLYEDIYQVLYAIDALYEQRYGWIALRLDRVTGTLPRLQRFDETAEEQEAELLQALLMTEGGG